MKKQLEKHHIKPSMTSLLQFINEWIKSTVKPSYMKFIKNAQKQKTKTQHELN